MAREIGALGFDAMTGRPVDPAETGEELDRAVGENHHRYRLTGVVAAASTIRTTHFAADAATARAHAAACLALQWTTQDITDATDEVYDDCMILAVVPVIIPCLHGADRFRVETEWRVRKAAGG